MTQHIENQPNDPTRRISLSSITGRVQVVTRHIDITRRTPDSSESGRSFFHTPSRIPAWKNVGERAQRRPPSDLLGAICALDARPAF